MAPVTAPTPPEMESPVAPVTSQASVALPPGPTTRGLAAKDRITGGSVGGTTTVTVASAVEVPPALVAERR